MNEAVVDASVLIFALTSRSPDAEALGDRVRQLDTHAPHLIDAECGSSLRRLVRSGEITPNQGFSALRTTRTMVDFRHDHDAALGDLAWGLRDRMSFYDALYVSLAARLDVLLLTSDGRLARAHGLPCRVELIG